MISEFLSSITEFFKGEKVTVSQDVNKISDKQSDIKNNTEQKDIGSKLSEQQDVKKFNQDKLVEKYDPSVKEVVKNKKFNPDDLVESAEKNNILPEVDEAREVEKKKGEPIQNKVDGLRREKEVGDDLKEKYPESEGYKVESEKYLRDKDGKIVKDPETGEARRIDYVVIKDGKVVDSVEVTSKTADKTEQTAKEKRIRENGGNYILDDDGNLVEIPENVETRIERRD